jgi:hypothetical protein
LPSLCNREPKWANLAHQFAGYDAWEEEVKATAFDLEFQYYFDADEQSVAWDFVLQKDCMDCVDSPSQA